LDPIGQQQRLGRKIAGCAAQQLGESRPKGAGRGETGIHLRLDHFAAQRQHLEPVAQAALAGHFQKGHAKVAFERAADGRKVMAHPRDAALGPAIIRAGFQRGKKGCDGGVGHGHRL
jgi:hypothetical protein